MQKPFPYIGGKRYLADTILSKMPDHRYYYEPFLGGGSVFFKKETRTNYSFLSDKNKELINFYKVIHLGDIDAMMAHLYQFPISNKGFTEVFRMEFFTHEHHKRAARLFYLQSLAYSGCTVYHDKRTSKGKAERFKKKLSHKENIKIKFHLLREHIKNHKALFVKTDFENTLNLASENGKEAFVYLDPPYFQTQKENSIYYPVRFGIEDHRRLRDILWSAKFNYILSLPHEQFVHELYKGFKAELVHTRHVSRDNRAEKIEVLISNF